MSTGKMNPRIGNTVAATVQVIILVLLILFVIIKARSQDIPKGLKPISQKKAIEKATIDFSKEVLIFKLTGIIEVDGHIFDNDTSRHAIYYIANLDGVTLKDTVSDITFTHRTCTKPGCKIIHLEMENTWTIPSNRGVIVPGYITPNWGGTYQH